MQYFKTYIRHLIKNKLFTGITIFGFSVALLFIILLTVYIDRELAVDNFQEKKDRIFRLETEDGAADFPAPIAVQLKNENPEIEDFTRVIATDGIIATQNSQKFKFNSIGVDQGFLNIFSFPLLEGNRKSALLAKKSILISEATAIKLFQQTSVIGKKVIVNSSHEFTITGVFKNFSDDTHFHKQDVIMNVQSFGDLFQYETIMEDIGFGSFSMYFLEKEGADLPAKASEILKRFKKDFWIYKDGWANDVVFSPLKDLYFSPKESHAARHNSKSLILVMSFIVFLILMLAIINYINLTIAQTSFRIKEISIKKLLGSTKKKLIISLAMESVVLCLFALIIAIILVKYTEPVFNSLLDTRLNLNEYFTFKNILLLTLVFSFIGFISGILPATFMTKFKAVDVMKGTAQLKTKSVFAKGLITFQYTTTIALVCCTAFVIKQTHFMRNYELGFERDHLMQIDYVGSYKQKETIKNALKQIPGVQHVTLTTDSPLTGGSNLSFDHKSQPVSFQEFRVDEDFLTTFNIKKLQPGTRWDKSAVFVNEIGAKTLGITSFPVTIPMNDGMFTIIGSVNNFNFNELHKNIGPAFIRPAWNGLQPFHIFIKLDGTNSLNAVTKIKETYNTLVDGTPYDYSFVDDHVNQWYEKEERTSKIIGYFTLLSLLLSALGILGMATFYMRQRRKEIGIRKVHGSTILNDIIHLNKDFMKWVVLAFILATPLSYFAISRWLEEFAYKTTLSWWVFVLSGIITIIVALFTVSWQSWKTAINNPIDALRTE